jgi:hypothetical protein
MRDWIIIVALYAFGAGFFHLLGGVDSASDALSRWGRARSEQWRRRTSSS